MSRVLAAAEPTAAEAVSRPAPKRRPSAIREPGMETSALAIGAFAGLPAGAVSDPDGQRALLTALLLEQLAPALGLDPTRIRIRCDPGAAARLDAAGAQGLQEGSNILLHPARFRPETSGGRGLLAHEAAHAAQRLLTGPSDEAEAEREAAAIAEAVIENRRPDRPVVPLRTLRAAADAGQVAAAPDPKQVLVSRQRELAVIRKALSGWWVSDGDVFRVLAILEAVPHAVIEPLLNNLSEKERYWLADNINPPHVYRNRRTALACYQRTLTDARLRDAIDLKVMRALPLFGMTTEEQETAAWILEHLSHAQREELLASDNGAAIAHIMGAPLPSAEELQRIRDESKKAAKAEAELHDKQVAADAQSGIPETQAALDMIKTLLGDKANAGTARRALEVIGEGGVETARFQYLADQLDEAGLIDKLVKLLPVKTLFDTTHGATLFALVRSRLPIKNEELIESQLSYHITSWAIRDDEALYAYKLIKSLPLSAQHKFRLRDGGKWYLRLLENLPTDPSSQRGYPGLEIRKAETQAEIEELRKAGAKQIDEKELLYNASELQEKRLEDVGATTVLNDILAAFREAEKGIYRDHEARGMYVLLAGVGSSVLTAKADKPADRLLREAVVHELDRLGHIDRLFDNLPDSFLFNEENRITTVQIMMARDPSRARAHARELVSTGFTDWMVKDGEAWLAYQCVKALPPDEREAFIAEEPDAWKRILGEMSESQRQASDLNLYVGDKAGTDRASVLGQLAEAQTWTEDNSGIVTNLVRMAISMTEHRFAFAQSEKFLAYAKGPKLAAVVEKFRLYHKVERPHYEPTLLKGTHWYEEGVFATLRQVWGGLVTVVRTDLLLVEGGIGIRTDVRDVQGMMGGNLFGARVADPAKRDADQPLPHPEANKLSLIIRPFDKSAELRLPELELESSNIQMGGSTLQFSRLMLRGLQLEAAFATDQRDQPVRASAEVASVQVDDLLISKSSSMLAIGRLFVGALRAAVATVDAITRPSGSEKQFAVPFLLIVPHLIGMLAVAALPYYIYKKIAGALAQGLDKGITDELLDDVARHAKAISFTLGSLDVDNLSTSGGQHVGHAGLRDFSVQVGLNRSARLRAERASIQARLTALEDKPESKAKREALNGRLAEIDKELNDVAAGEREYIAIMNQLRAGGLSPERQKALQGRLDALHFEDEGKVFIDIGAIETSGLQGQITAKEPIRIAGIHGEGGSASLNRFLALPTVTDAELNRRFVAGDRPLSPLDDGMSGDFRLDIGDVRTGELRIGGGLRTVKDIDAEIEKLKPRREHEAIKPLYESLLLLRPKAERYERTVQHGVSRLDADQLEEFRALRRDLAAQASLIVKSIEIVEAKLDVDFATGAVGFGAASIRVSGIEVPATGLEMDEVIVRGLGLRAVPKGGILGIADWRKNLRDLGAQADSVEVSGARSRYHGLLFEKATLTGPYARLRNRGDKIELGLKRFGVENIGIAPRIGLLQQKLDGMRAQARQAGTAEKPKLEASIRQLEGIISGLQQLVDSRLAAYAQLQRAKTPDEIKAAKDKVAEADAQIAVGLAQYGATEVSLDEFGVAVSGAGDLLTDVLDGGVDPLAVLKRGGVSVQGTGPNKRLFKNFSVHGGQMSADAPMSKDKSISGEVGSFEIGETRLDVNARMEGQSIVVGVPDFSLASLSIESFLFTSAEAGGSLQFWSDGKSGIEGIKFVGEVRLDPKVENPAGLADYRLAHLTVNSFRIDAIRASGLGLAIPNEKLEVTIKSGAITGIYAEGMDVDLPADAKAAPIVTGKAGIEAIDDVIIGKAVAGAWQVDGGKIRMRKLEAAFLKEGEIEASLGSLSLLGFGVRGPDGWVRFSLADMGANLHYKNGILDVRDFHIGRFEVSALHWRAGAKGMVDADQPVVLSDLRVSALAEIAKPAADGKKPAHPISRLMIRKLHVGGFEAKHLKYQDEDYVVEIGREQYRQPKYLQGFKGIELKNLDIWDLEWKEGKGLTQGQASLESYEGSAAIEGLKSSLKVGAVLRGGGMKAEVKGEGVFSVDIGKVKEMRGDYSDGKLSTRFGTGEVTGSVVVGPNFMEAQNILINDLALAATSYTDGPLKLGLKALVIEKARIGRARLDYKESPDPATPGARILTKLTISDVELLDTFARTFRYEGSSTVKTADNKEVTAMQDIRADGARMKRLQLGTIVHDAERAQTILSGFKLDAGPKAGTYQQPFTIRNLSAVFVSGIGDKPTTTKLVTDVEAGPLVAERIVFEKILLGSAPGPDGKPVPVTRTSVDGEFTLSRLGLINPNLTLTDTKGDTYFTSHDRGSVEILGMKPRFLSNGTMLLPIDAVVAKNLKVKHGNMEVAIPFARISKIAVGLEGMGTKEGIDLLGARLEEIKVEGLHFTLTKETKEKLTAAEHATAVAEWEKEMKARAAKPPARFIAEPLSGATGSAEGEFSIPYFPDADVAVELDDGDVDVDVMHPVAPGLMAIISGLIPEPNLRKLVEKKINDAPGRPERVNEAMWYLNHLRLKGKFSLGAGRMGMDEDLDGILGNGDYWAELTRVRPNQNMIELLDSVIGEDLQLRVPEIYAGKAGFAAGHTKSRNNRPGKQRLGTTGPISIVGINIGVSGLGSFNLHLSIYVRKGEIQDVKIGEVEFLDPQKLLTRPPPSATDVDPAATATPPKPAATTNPQPIPEPVK
ncbi:MAG TPA: DUF4157 domain-containing protein [Sphingomicrobium sp.]|nr:DUF4157 domain-containing protein [Sphingomicrobium sp.]